MKVLTLIFLLFLGLYADSNRQELMDSISQHAIRIGTGPVRIYSFIDPLCSQSKRFINLINERQDLQQKNSYYIFLYRLPRFESDKLIQYIYQSEDPLKTLKEIMIEEYYDEMDDFKASPHTYAKINAIAKTAEQLRMEYRPYLLIFKEGSSYCKISDGTAPCMEENHFK